MELKDKIPPHNLDAEQATIGALLMDWSHVSQIVAKLSKEDFYTQQNQLIFEAITELSTSGDRGDLLTIKDNLEKKGKLDAAGGASYISSLIDLVPTSANINYYADIVKDMSTRRKMIEVSAKLRQSSFDEANNSREMLEEAQKTILSLTDSATTSKIHEMKDVIQKAITIIDQRYKNKSSYSGVPSGLVDLDNLTSGFQNSEMIIVGARPSMGKTALALSMMEHIAIDQNIPCGFFSLEMAAEQISQRLLAQVARVPSHKIRSGMLKIDDFKKLQDAAGACYNAPLYICDTPNMKLLDLLSMARQMKISHDVKIIFIDYIGLITAEDTKKQSFEQISDISKTLKQLARQLEIPIVVLCQVARDAEGNEPTLAQLRGSGSIEQDADVVMFIHGDRAKQKQNGEQESFSPVVDRKLIVAKQRNGPIGDVDVLFIPSYTKFENKSKQSM